MPFAATALIAAITSLVAFFAKFLTKRLAITAALIVALVALTTAFYTTVSSLLVGIEAVMPGFVADGLCWLLPDNLQACITAMIVAKIAEYAYVWNAKIIQYKLF